MDTVKVILKHFPLQSHKEAKLAAYAAIAAGHQGKFWEYHHELFANFNRLDTPGIFIKIAQSLHLDMAQFAKDWEDPNAKKMVEQDILDGKKAGVTGVPSIYINGRPLERMRLDTAQEMIDNELKKLGIKK